MRVSWTSKIGVSLELILLAISRNDQRHLRAAGDQALFFIASEWYEEPADGKGPREHINNVGTTVDGENPRIN